MRADIFTYSILAILFSTTALARDQYHEVTVVPAPGAVKVDGKLDDWDLSGAIDTYNDEALSPNFSARVAFMYDAEALYVAAHFMDSTPMVNAHDPAVEPDRGWDGDALQVRLYSNPSVSALPSERFNTDDRICHLTMWHYTGGKLPALATSYGMDYHGGRLLTGAASGLAFLKDADGKGYTLEGRFPWALLHAAKGTPKAGDKLVLTIQCLWGTADGFHYTMTYDEVVGKGTTRYQDPSGWGRAFLSPVGKLSAASRVKTAAEKREPLTLNLALPDEQARMVSVGIFNTQDVLVRTLPVTAREKGEMAKELRLTWDGLDDGGNPLPAGEYTAKVLTHRGIGQKFVVSLHNSGTPPWRTDDGVGGWGGDTHIPIAAASDGSKVYLGWWAAESGTAIICVEPALTKEGTPRKIWGQNRADFHISFLNVALVVDKESRLFVGVDAPYPNDKATTSKATVSLFDARTGRPLNFPFGKPSLLLSEWPWYGYGAGKPLFERLKTHDFGPQSSYSGGEGLNLVDIAVCGDILYGSLFREDKVVAVNWKTGQKVREFAVPRPAGLKVEKNGRLLVASQKGILRIDLETSAQEQLVKGALTDPWGLTLDARGNIYVADCGKAMQVKVFSPEGKLLRTVGKAGGRPWIGSYDPQGMLMPAGLTVDADGKLWVAEAVDTPHRISVWDANGKLAGDFHGATYPSTGRGVDPARPNLVHVEKTLYDVNYETGAYRCVSTLWRANVNGWSPHYESGQCNDFSFRTIRGRTYAFQRQVGSHRQGTIFMVNGDKLRPITSIGYSCGLPVRWAGNPWGQACDVMKLLSPDQTKVIWDEKKGAIRDHWSLWHTWVDRNGDGAVQADEIRIDSVQGVGGYFIKDVDEDLTLWAIGPAGQIYRIPVKEWTKDGIPLYPSCSEVRSGQPVVQTKGGLDGCLLVDPVLGRLYIPEYEGGSGQEGAKWAAVSCYQLDGKRLWSYTKMWPGMALDAPLWKPGYLIGVWSFVGMAKLPGGPGLLVANGYYGQYHMLSTDGLWIHAFCKDKRYGAPNDQDAQYWAENFGGAFFRNKDNGKCYLLGGDCDGRIWEVTGLETIRTAKVPVTLSEADHKLASEAAAGRTTVGPQVKTSLAMERAKAVRIDGKLDDWDMGRAYAIDAEAGRSARIALAYDDKYLYAAFDVRTDSPMKNAGRDSTVLFKTGDTCDVMLAADPQADPKRTKPVPGDMRLLFSMSEGKPVCVMYEARVKDGGKKSPQLFTSATGQETFERVAVLDDAQVAVVRSDKGYLLEAAVPLAAIGFAPKPGTMTRGDVGVLFANAGGNLTIRRVYVANKETSITDDVPTEVRLEPAKWTTLEVK